ncbi:hypothetical protein VTK73DRAFT_2693 [Phialemonium thermophilum]|uniref:F-box domain-containing protein n=1 Tax=Phialemonium thermophilum TaxID=223376 RepID=A0ABR3X2X3_9PEZI
MSSSYSVPADRPGRIRLVCSVPYNREPGPKSTASQGNAVSAPTVNLQPSSALDPTQVVPQRKIVCKGSTCKDDSKSDRLRKKYRLDHEAAAPVQNRSDVAMNDKSAQNWLEYITDEVKKLPFAYQERIRQYLCKQAEAHRAADAAVAEEAAKAEASINQKDTKFEILITQFDIVIEIGKHLKPKDILNLYCISRTFHAMVDQYLASTIRTWAEAMAPASARTFPYELYRDGYIADPAGRIQPLPLSSVLRVLGATGSPNDMPSGPSNGPPAVRLVPSLKWLQMVSARETRVRDILACLARAGHRTPPTTHDTLTKLWLITDVPVSNQRRAMIQNKNFFSDEDLYNAQIFFTKIELRFTDPIYGLADGTHIKALLGQRDGFSTVWRVLRRKTFTCMKEVLVMILRYDIPPTQNQLEADLPIFGVPAREQGNVRREWWGVGTQMLMRPDELVIEEAVRRQLGLEYHLEAMLAYGRVDLATGRNLAPTLEELYMSDEELDDVPPDLERGIQGGCGNVPFNDWEWTPVQARKANWDNLAQKEKDAILRHENDEILRSLAWEIGSDNEPEPAKMSWTEFAARLEENGGELSKDTREDEAHHISTPSEVPIISTSNENWASMEPSVNNYGIDADSQTTGSRNVSFGSTNSASTMLTASSELSGSTAATAVSGGDAEHFGNVEDGGPALHTGAHTTNAATPTGLTEEEIAANEEWIATIENWEASDGGVWNDWFGYLIGANEAALAAHGNAGHENYGDIGYVEDIDDEENFNYDDDVTMAGDEEQDESREDVLRNYYRKF